MAESDTSAPLPFVTVAIGTYNRARWLKEAIAFVVSQDYPLDRWDFIVVDNKCTDNTREVVESFAGARKPPRYFYESNPGSSYARNRAIAETRPETDIILFTDDDVMGRTNWLRLMIEPLIRPGNENVAGVAGEITPHFPDGLPKWIEGQFRALGYRKDMGPLPPHHLPSTCNAALRKSVLDKVGHFRTDLGRLPNRLTAGEDHDLMRRILEAGYIFWCSPQADVLHVVPGNRLTFKYAWKLQFDAACSRVIERIGHPGYRTWLATRILLYGIHLPLTAIIGGLCFLVGMTGTGKRWLTRTARAWGYVYESIRVTKRKLCGQKIDVYS